MHSPFGWACFLLGLDFGSQEIGIICRSDGTQACGKPDLPLPGFASCMLHALSRTEPATLDLMPPNSHFPSPGLAQILLLAQLQCCSQYSSGHEVLLSFGEVALMVRAETSQDGDSVVPPTVWFFAVRFAMLLQKWDNVSLQCRNAAVCITRAHFGGTGGRQETCKIFPAHLCQSQTVGKDQNL